MATRTGHPYPQTLRRQQKWDMLEQWKMAELLVVLPSMIHVALLLFSIGLCVLLWETHRVVALPVICITGVAFSFYVWLSMTAVVLDWFPYPTIVSKLCRTEIARHVAHVISQVASHLMHNLKLLCSSVGFVVLRTFQYLLLVPGIPVALIDGLLEEPLDKWHSRFASHSLLLRLLTMPLYWFLYLLVWKPASKVFSWLGNLFDYLESTGDSIKSRLSKPKWRLESANLQSALVAKSDSFSAGHNSITSLAISWLIKNCEVPQSVDIALQSLAGAGKGFAYEPLRECNAAVEISKRLASSNIYRDSQVQKIVLLYSRALSFLSSASNPSSNRSRQDAGDELEVMIWNLQTLFENNVAGLITDGEFQPSPQNLAALQIGNTAASHSLKLMKDSHKGSGELFDSITQMMTRHLAEEPLHPSALLSLANAASLLSLFTDSTSSTPVLPGLCVQILQRNRHLDTPLLRSSLVTCVLLHSKYLQHKKSQLLTEAGASYKPSEEIMQALIDLQAHDGESAIMVAAFGLEELSRAPANSYLENHASAIESTWGLKCAIDINSAAATLKAGAVSNNVRHCLQALHTTYRLVRVGAPYTETYEFVLAVICRDPPSRLQGWQMFSKFCFPRASRLGLCNYLRKYSIIDSLVEEIDTSNQAMRFFVAGQLWLFFTHCVRDDPRDIWSPVLPQLLEKYAPAGIQGDEPRHQHLGELMEELWDGSSKPILESLGAYGYRLMECVYQWRNCPISQQIHDGLHDTPQELCGLSSFLDSRSLPVAGEEGKSISARSSTTESTDAAEAIHSPNHATPAAGNVEQNRASNGDEDIQKDSSLDKDPQDGPRDRATGATVHRGDTEEEIPGDEGDTHQVMDGPPDDIQNQDGTLGEVSITEDGGGREANSTRGGTAPVNKERGARDEASKEDNEMNGPGNDDQLGGSSDHIAIDIPKVAGSGSRGD